MPTEPLVRRLTEAFARTLNAAQQRVVARYLQRIA
jgi:hypothetical protein